MISMGYDVNALTSGMEKLAFRGGLLKIHTFIKPP